MDRQGKKKSTKSASAVALRKQHYRQLSKLLGPQKWFVCFVVLTRSSIIAITIANALFLNNVLSRVGAGESTNIALDVGLTLGCMILYAIVQWLINYWFETTTYNHDNIFRVYLYRNYLLGNIAGQYTSNEILSRIYEETRMVVENFVFFTVSIVMPIIEIGVYIALIFVYTWIVGVLVVVLVPIMILLVRSLNKRVGKYTAEYNQQSSLTRGVFLQGVMGLNLLKIMQRCQYYSGVLERAFVAESIPYKKLRSNNATYQSFVTITVSTLPILFATITTVLYGVGLVSGIGVGMLVYLLVSRFLLPFNQLVGFVRQRAAVSEVCKRLSPFMTTLESRFGEVELDRGIEKVDVVIQEYRYDEQKRLLQGFEMHCVAGESVCIVGESGSGKSTLFRLLLNQIDLGDGYIKVNGIGLREVEQRSYYSQVGYVQQSSFMFRQSVLDNITLGCEYSQDEIERVVQDCGLREFVDTYGMDKIIEEGNDNISGGQLQRLSLARALIRRPSLILLDEPTASLDADTGTEIVKSLLEYVESNKLIMICVTHDKQVIDLFDKTISISAS